MQQEADCLAACAAMVLDHLGHLETIIDDDQPVIVLVRTGELPYWQGVDTFHSVVIVGYDQMHVFVNDPYFGDAPQMVARADFLLAWLEMGYRYAAISGA